MSICFVNDYILPTCLPVSVVLRIFTQCILHYLTADFFHEPDQITLWIPYL